MGPPGHLRKIHLPLEDYSPGSVHTVNPRGAGARVVLYARAWVHSGADGDSGPPIRGDGQVDRPDADFHRFFPIEALPPFCGCRIDKAHVDRLFQRRVRVKALAVLKGPRVGVHKESMDLPTEVIGQKDGPAVTGHGAGVGVIADVYWLPLFVHTGSRQVPDGLERPGPDVDQGHVGGEATVGDKEVSPVRSQGHVLGEEGVDDRFSLFVHLPGVVGNGDVAENRGGVRVGDVEEVDDLHAEVGDNRGLAVRGDHGVEESPAFGAWRFFRRKPLHLPVQKARRESKGAGVHRLDRAVGVAVDGDQASHSCRRALPLKGSLGADRRKDHSLSGLRKIVLVGSFPAEAFLLFLGEPSCRQEESQHNKAHQETTASDG
ncbi:MAG: hypothetical protein BWY86_00795 [Candidatus Aminicenantes bacterium ADurb.Bin508]|nr:MAG: hypothetical protein BWY86_00795 [Candidatus Aminicenantes bacterium ADurb.Bin508]